MVYRNVLSNHPKKDGMEAIQPYVYYGQTKKYIPTGLSVHRKDWNRKKGCVKKSHPLADRYNRKLVAHRYEVESYVLDGGRLLDFGKKRSRGSMIDYLEKYISNNSDLRPNTIKAYNTALSRLKEYRDKNGLTDIRWDDIDRHWYNRFCTFIHEKGIR